MIHIALAFDQNYIIPIYVLLTSIFHNNKGNEITLHLIVTGCSEEDLNKLKLFIEGSGADVTFYKINLEDIEQRVYVPENTYYTPAVYYRLLLPHLVPESVERLIYIDSDTIVIGSLNELYNNDISKNPIGAVSEVANDSREELGIFKGDITFNSGVLLINNSRWREQKITEKAFEFIEENPEKIIHVDQDVLNVVLRNNWMPLDNKFNVTLVDVVLQVPKKRLLEGKVIIHFNSQWKPWHCLTRNKLRSVYHYYQKLSPKMNEKKYVDFAWRFNTLKPYLRMRIKERYFDHGVHKLIPIKSWKEAGSALY
jgi:lipopolysaccharide biosynthesis glycosyltransferase